MAAKMKSKRHRDNSRLDWKRVRVDIMRWCRKVKLVQNWDKFSNLLKKAGARNPVGMIFGARSLMAATRLSG